MRHRLSFLILTLVLLSQATIQAQYAHFAKQVPVLCYHQVRDRRNTDSKSALPYIISPKTFGMHMKMLHDSGYHAILPEALVDYLAKGKTLPAKPVLITFDDGTAAQYEQALPVLDMYGFKATFFIMTVTLDKKGYLTRKQVKALSDRGHVIGCHTWDHQMVTKYKENDWYKQLAEPAHELELITGRRILYFAYPFGVWDRTAIDKLKELDYKAAFQLSGKPDEYSPRYTIRRIIADGGWDIAQLDRAIKRSFK